MGRIEPITKDNANEDIQEIYDGMEDKLGMVPNIYKGMATSPQALKANLCLGDNLGEGEFSGKEIETIALAVSAVNDCEYCLAAHTAAGKKQGLSEDETIEIRSGEIDDVKLKALSDLAKNVAESRGNPEPDKLKAFYDVGYNKKAMVELIGFVALNTFNNYFNHIAGTEVDFPAIQELETA